MRKIKFRAWDKIASEFINDGFGAPLVIDLGGTLRETRATPTDTILLGTYRHDSNMYELMQYTGLKDGQGIEIYEGDILRTVTNYYGNRKECHTVVEWIDDMQDDSFGEPTSTGYRIYGGEWEVIGNIYENPELLKGDN